MKVFTIEHSKTVYFMDFVVYLTLILLLTLLLVHFAPFSTETVIAIAAGLLIWSLIEYAMHRH